MGLLLYLLGCDMTSSSRATGGSLDGTGAVTTPVSRPMGLERSNIVDEKVLEVMYRLPRHLFVPDHLREEANDDRALPIGAHQTISQPYIVALMTQEANVSAGSKVLEIGTGSGYQAAVLAELGAKVFSMEIIPELAESARKRLSGLGYSSISVRVGDGWKGWPEEAPFDAILVTAAAPVAPPELLKQLANRGRLIIPLEIKNEEGETLVVIERKGDDFVTKNLGAVRFVPLTGEGRTN